MRKAGHLGLNSRVEKSISDLTQFSRQLEKRVSRLEELVFPLVDAEPAQEPKSGRKQRLATEGLVERRDALILWLESNWPELRTAIRRAREPRDLGQAFRSAEGLGSYPWKPEFHQQPENYSEALCAFLRSGRYRENPRNIANAMAGLPYMGWKRSFDICSSHPSQLDIHPRAVADYLRRKAPYRLRALVRAKTVEEVSQIMAKRTKDRHLLRFREQAHELLDWIRAGEPQRG